MKKLILAPMATLSHEAFRRSVEGFGGCSEYFTEMINASSLLNMGPFEKYYLLNGPVPEKIVWQLTGWDAPSLSKAAKVVAPLGGIGVDLNMGCSAPQIYKTGAGIAWMLKPMAETEAAVKGVKESLNEYENETGIHRRLSVKCRLGADNFTDESFFAFTDMLVKNGVECITLHARTQKEKFRTLPKYDYVEQLALRYANRNVEIYLNGDVKDAASAKYAAEKCPHASGIMIARAAAVKPWLFNEIEANLTAAENGVPYEKNHSVDREEVALKFIDDVVECQPEEFYRTRIQRFFGYYCQQFAFGHYFQSKVQNYKGIEEAKNEVKEYFVKQAYEKTLLY